MPAFGKQSINRLATCHPKLQDLMKRVVKLYDITVIEGYRTPEDQIKALKEGKSKVGPEQSTHCRKPSMAVDVAPYPVNWQDRERFYYLAGLVRAVADQMGIKVRWGGDWDQDQDFRDQTFDDLCHFELK
jgi:molybdopterin-guanine dinucleotide biosynthesis protein